MPISSDCKTLVGYPKMPVLYGFRLHALLYSYTYSRSSGGPGSFSWASIAMYVSDDSVTVSLMWIPSESSKAGASDGRSGRLSLTMYKAKEKV